MIRRSSLVIMFHEVSDRAWFEKVVIFFKKNYRLSGADDILKAVNQSESSKGICHFSFDDGHKSFITNVLPVLIRHEVPASLFVSPKITKETGLFWFQKVKALNKFGFTEFVRKRCSEYFPNLNMSEYSASAILKCFEFRFIDQMTHEFCRNKSIVLPQNVNINVDDLKQIVNSDLVEVGAHTLNHPILANESEEAVRFEINSSIEQVAELTERKVFSFACPNGLPELDFGIREKQIMVDAGITINFSTITDYLTDKYGGLSIPRIGVTKGSTSFIDAKILVAKPWVYYRKEMCRNSELNQRRRLLSRFKRLGVGNNVG